MVDADLSGNDNVITNGAFLAPLVQTRVATNEVIPANLTIILSNATSAAFPINAPAAPGQMQVVSTSALDSAAGIGIQQVAIEYLTAPPAFAKKIDLVNLNGVAPVLTNATDIFRIDRFRSNRVGAGLFAQGNVSLQSVGGAITWEQIDIRTNAFRTAIHYLEKGFRTQITDIIVGSSTAGGVIFKLLIFEQFGNNLVLISQREIELATGAIAVPLNSPIITENPDGQIKGFVIIVSGRASNQAASGSFAFIDSRL